jgi:hypothetical protein
MIIFLTKKHSKKSSKSKGGTAKPSKANNALKQYAEETLGSDWLLCERGKQIVVTAFVPLVVVVVVVD